MKRDITRHPASWRVELTLDGVGHLYPVLAGECPKRRKPARDWAERWIERQEWA